MQQALKLKNPTFNPQRFSCLPE